MTEPKFTPPGMTVVEHGIEAGIHWATCRARLGAVNGYVHIPKGHPWDGLDYDDIDVDVHGGLTYARNGWIGFDTLHSGDYWPGMPWQIDGDRHWTAEQVAAETRQLARKVAAAENLVESTKLTMPTLSTRC